MEPRYVLVMPNLFYGRTIERVFDLKVRACLRCRTAEACQGSARNRYIKVWSSKWRNACPSQHWQNVEDEEKESSEDKRVLLDLNFMEWTHGYPIPLHPHAKASLLHRADTCSPDRDLTRRSCNGQSRTTPLFSAIERSWTTRSL